MQSYYKKRFPRIILPYLVYSTGYILFGVLRGNGYSVGNLVYAYLTGQAAMPFYYSICLIWLTAITPLLMDALKNRKITIAIVALTPILQIVGYATQCKFDVAEYVKYTPVWIGFYVAGLAVGNGYFDLGRLTTKKKALLTCILCYYLSLVETYVLLKSESLGDIAYSQWHFGAFLWTGSLIVLIEVLAKENRSNRLLVYIGDRSYGIYFIHCFFISIFNAVTNRIALTIPFPVERWMQFLFAVGGSLAVIKIIKVIFPKKICRTFFGI